MNKQQLLDKIEHSWRAFMASIEGLSETELMTPGVTEAWSVRDLVAHVAAWDEEALKNLPLIMAGTRPPRYKDLYGGIDAFNDMKVREAQALSPAEALAAAADTHRRLLELVEAAPDELFTRETRFRRRLRLDTYSHYPIHTRAINEWRASQGN